MTQRMFPFFPGQGGQGQGFGPPGGGGGGGMAPQSPPPSYTPHQSQGFSLGGGGGGGQGGQPGLYAVDPGAIRPCLYQFVFIWPSWGPGFWAWLTFVGRRSVAGFRWNGRRWVYFGMDTRQINSFFCS
ncbi:transporter [Bacillus sp. NEB1478]|uniref:transporter n=1 Tax=Bacillus sp. NEB1478 TaxID=3073816 RepID=UPI002872F7C9|nr:transporter [Bacillus sp. NEB1478]WNB90714.1 transporter [Bacillus sp. NEB1478]